MLRLLTEKALHSVLDRLDAIAVREGVAASEEEFLLAGYLAARSFETRTNIARSMRYEFLLWLSGKRDIKSAMALTGPRDGDKSIIIVWFSETDERGIIQALEGESLPLGLKEKADPLDLERISLSRVKN
jgi:tRNA threonylcarbamoyladenosine modification (KEOPS) complex Cgi121 subunit